MIETDIITCINQNLILPREMKKIVEQDNGVHPMDRTFLLVGKIDEFNMGTPTKTLTSRTGQWVFAQTIGYDVRIGLQGRKNAFVDDEMEDLKMRLALPNVRQAFMDMGYTYDIDPQTISIPIQLNTDMYVRHTFKVRFKTSRMITFHQDSMLGVKVEGRLEEARGQIVSEIEVDIKDV